MVAIHTGKVHLPPVLVVDRESVLGRFFRCEARYLKGKARVKRAMWSRRAQEYEQKINSGDLMAIADPNKLARKPLTNGVLTFPFFTIENVEIVDATHIIVGNDNNLPFSSSREPNQADDNELILLEVGDFLRAQ